MVVCFGQYIAVSGKFHAINAVYFGPEISAVGVDVMTAVCEKFGHKVSYEHAICGAHAIDEVGDPAR